MTIRHLRSFFPDIDWPKHIRRFRRDQLIKDDEAFLAPAKGIERGFQDEIAGLKALWVTRLEELSDHPDCAFFLSLHYVAERRFDDAILALADVAITMEPNWWAGLYTTAFDALNKPKICRKLKPDTRLAFHRAFGHCLSVSGRFEDARGQYEKLRRAGNRLKNVEAVGLALLNLGVSYHKDGDVESAITWYQRAREYGVEHGQAMLTSHALGNLGQIEVDFDPQNAIELLEQSIAYKITDDDQVGIAGSLQVLAVAHAELNEFEKAIEYYDRAESIAEDFDLRYLRSLLLHNKANTLLQVGKRTESLRTFKKALKIADAEGFSELTVRSTEGICRVHFIRGSLDEAETSMLDLLGLSKDAALREFEMTAHHGLWAVYSLKNDMKLAKRHFTSLTRIARKLTSYEWLVRALVDKSKSIDADGFGVEDPKTLSQLIRAESRRNDPLATGWLWHALAQILADQNVDGAIDALLRCIECFSHEPDMIAGVLDAHEDIYVLQWESGRFAEAIQTLDTIARLAKDHRVSVSEIAAIDQKGFCLQELGRYSEAMPLHKRAAGRAKRLGLEDQTVTSLHNLAECHRRSGDPASAVKVFEDARVVATDLNDVESVIQIDHGLALALESLQDYDAAVSLFRNCRSRSAKTGCWPEYVRACEAIANLSWSRGRMKTAVKQYEAALAACKEHDVLDAMPQIAFNLSRLLRLLGRTQHARRLLAKHIDAVDDPLLFSGFHSTLAELCEETNRIEDSRRHWRIAVESAEAVGNEDDIVFCRSQFEEFERKQDTQNVSVCELEALLKRELSAEDRATILKQLFNALLQAKSERRAKEVFDLAQEHMQQHDFTAHLIDIYMSVFDYNWHGNRESRFNSLQAYVGAFAAAAEDSEFDEYSGKILGHVMRTLTERTTAPPLRQLEWLHTRFDEWLSDQLSDGEHISILEMPLRYAKRLIPFNDNPVRMLEEHEKFGRELDEEM